MALEVLSVSLTFGLHAHALSTQAFGTIDWVLNATTARGGARGAALQAARRGGPAANGSFDFDVRTSMLAHVVHADAVE